VLRDIPGHRLVEVVVAMLARTRTGISLSGNIGVRVVGVVDVGETSLAAWGIRTDSGWTRILAERRAGGRRRRRRRYRGLREDAGPRIR
jgi:hypothetical protein